MKIQYLILSILLILFVSSNLVLSETNDDALLTPIKGKRNPKPPRLQPKPTKSPKPKTPSPTKTAAPKCPHIECQPGQALIKLGATGTCSDYVCSTDGCSKISCGTHTLCKPNEKPTGCCPCRL